MRQFLFNKKILIPGIIIISIIIYIIFKTPETIPIVLAETPSVEETQEEIFVDIKGAVKNPGVYQVEENSRVQNAIELAGGLTKEGDLSNINLSVLLFNEMVIIIPTKSDEVSIVNDAQIKNITSLVPLNTASLEELMTLSGIGASKANAIIKYREKAPFNNIEEIINVSGIGVATYEKNKDRLSL